MLGGTPYQGGLPSQPVWITPFGVESFLYVKAKEWGNPSNRGNLITAPKPAKTHDRMHGCQRSLAWLAIWRFHLQNRQNVDEIDSAGDKLSMESDSHAT